MPSSQCAQQPPTALGYSINTDQGSAGVKPPLAIPEVLSARTLASAQAMVRAAENTLSGAFPGTPSSIHKSEYGPTNANGPYGHRKQEERPTQAWNDQQREIENLKQQLLIVTEKADHNVERMNQQWNDRTAQFQETALRFQQVAGDETQVKVAEVTTQAHAALQRKDQMINRLQERIQGSQQEKVQAYQSQQQKYEEEWTAQSVVYEKNTNEKMLQLIQHAQAEHATEKQGIEHEARQILECKQQEINDIQSKARERMQQIHDDAQRQSLHKDNQIAQLQVEHQQIADELKNRTEETLFYKQHYNEANTQLQQAQQAPSLQIVQTLQNELSQAHQVVKSQQWAQNNEHDESVKRIKELEQQVLHAEAVNFDLTNNTPCKVCQTFKQ